MNEDFTIQEFEKNEKFWENLSELYFYPTKSIQEFNDILESLEFGSECKSKRINNFKNLSLTEKIGFVKMELKNVESIKLNETD